jgi:hypothetical protein
LGEGLKGGASAREATLAPASAAEEGGVEEELEEIGMEEEEEVEASGECRVLGIDEVT